MTEINLAQFSQQFVPSLSPLLRPLQEVSLALAASHEDEIEKTVVPEVREIAHDLRVLLEKVEDQQAYVLVFGPLKSGKSTLMNALASSYVSEVTALPAYPCMVYVSYAPTKSFEISRYDGSTQVLRDTSAFQDLVDDAHAKLSRELRAAEERGTDFEPARDFPEALRRVDVRLPAEELRDSGAVLVDTPGLYSRMKFGYDEMTRGFRNNASCAVFVVKTDNLFLEQVFQEFEDLLGLFSRIFLVVNVDPHKRDLGADGELVPSVEAVEPERIVEAFRTYSMSRAMKDADEEGRLEIYPIDLLTAARKRIKGEAEDASSHLTVSGLRDDLMSFLASSEFMVAFVSDSLRQGDVLLERLGQLLRGKPLEQLESQLAEDRRQLEDVSRRHEAHGRASSFDWSETFEAFDTTVRQEASKSFAALRKVAMANLRMAVEDWFDSDESLADLLSVHARQAFSEHLAGCDEAVRQRIRVSSSRPAHGLDLPADLAQDFRHAGVELRNVSVRLADDIVPDPRASKSKKDLPPVLRKIAKDVQVDLDEIPVRRGFLDWILFRSGAKIRQRLFGDARSLDAPIPAALKEKRLGDPGFEELRGVLLRACDDILPAQEKAALRCLLDAHREAFEASVQQQLDAVLPDLEHRRGQLSTRVAHVEAVFEPVATLLAESDVARAALEEVREDFDPAARAERALEEVSEPVAFEDDDEPALEIAFGESEGDVLEDVELVPVAPVEADEADAEAEDAETAVASDDSSEETLELEAEPDTDALEELPVVAEEEASTPSVSDGDDERPRS